ncbi:hypothetical protein LTR94_024900, partial [Friedmanniomyces endolithicus]
VRGGGSSASGSTPARASAGKRSCTSAEAATGTAAAGVGTRPWQSTAHSRAQLIFTGSQGASGLEPSAGAIGIDMAAAGVSQAVTGLDANSRANTARMAGAQAAVVRRPIIKLNTSSKTPRLQRR